MAVITREQVTDVFAVPVKNAEIARVTAPPPARTRVVREPPPRTIFVRPVPETGCECDTDIDGALYTHLQDLVNEHSRHLCVCSPNRSDMLRAEAEMKAHPGYAEYKARRDAAMKGTRGARQ
jgi:hypothetical protein